MTKRRTLSAVCVTLGLIAVVGMGTAAEEGEDAAARLEAQRDQIEKFAAPLLKRAEDLEKFQESAPDHEIAVMRLTTEVEQMGKTLQVMQIRVKEYEQATFPSQRQAAEGSLKLAESDLLKAEDRLEWSEKMRKSARISDRQFQSAKLAHDKAQFALEEAKNKLKVLMLFTKLKTQTGLMADVEKTRSKQLALSQKLEDLKHDREATEQKLKRDTALTDPEILILSHLRDAIALQNMGQLDDAQKELDEVAGLSRVEQERRARIHLQETETRLEHAIGTLRNRSPISHSRR